MCFGILEFIAAIDEMLVRIESPVPTHPSTSAAIEASRTWVEMSLPTVAGKDEQLWRLLERFLGPTLAQDDLCHA